MVNVAANKAGPKVENDHALSESITHVHSQTIDLRKYPADRAIAAAHQDPERVEMPKESQPVHDSHLTHLTTQRRCGD